MKLEQHGAARKTKAGAIPSGCGTKSAQQSETYSAQQDRRAE
jgi:hypothetical protein